MSATHRQTQCVCSALPEPQTGSWAWEAGDAWTLGTASGEPGAATQKTRAHRRKDQGGVSGQEGPLVEDLRKLHVTSHGRTRRLTHTVAALGRGGLRERRRLLGLLLRFLRRKLHSKQDQRQGEFVHVSGTPIRPACPVAPVTVGKRVPHAGPGGDAPRARAITRLRVPAVGFGPRRLPASLGHLRHLPSTLVARSAWRPRKLARRSSPAMDLWGRSWRRVVPEAGGKRPSPPNRSRVNGWSRPLHSFQAVAWVTVLIMAVASFGIFIPFLPRDWKDVAYGATGGLFFLHLSVHLLAVSIDPAEPNVRRKKNYSEPVPTFDRSKHAHVIQDQYCHLCEVTVSPKAKHCSACNKCVSGFDHHCKWLNNCVGGRNYWYFFLSVASALAGLLCLTAVLLYVSIQFFIDPAELRTHPCYKKVSNKNTWLLFLPLFPVKVKTPVVLGIGVLVLLLDIIGLLLLGHLLVFHLYLMAKKLSTFDYMTQGRQQQTPRAAAEKEELSVQTRLPQCADSGPSPSAQSPPESRPRSACCRTRALISCPVPCSQRTWGRRET
ncbi:palmitoyltransferase ZDHHC11-like [Neovison vison]|nr:palmitoyltransferase ZDHHC11-like [Neogale vison]